MSETRLPTFWLRACVRAQWSNSVSVCACEKRIRVGDESERWLMSLIVIVSIQLFTLLLDVPGS